MLTPGRLPETITRVLTYGHSPASLKHQPMVEFYLFTFPCFPLRKKEHKSYFGKNRTHDFRTSRCAGYLLDHSGDILFRWVAHSLSLSLPCLPIWVVLHYLYMYLAAFLALRVLYVVVLVYFVFVSGFFPPESLPGDDVLCRLYRVRPRFVLV